MLETVIPRGSGDRVMVVLGEDKGRVSAAPPYMAAWGGVCVCPQATPPPTH